ncbi:integral membrane protein [Diplocarpon rosae]|nr:integral membrane protein [Diplocarpon rosae]
MGELNAQAKATTTASAVISALAAVAVVLRFYSRRVMKIGFKADEWWILAGFLLMLLTGVILLYGVRADPDGGEDINRDDPDFQYSLHVTYLKTSFIAATLYFSIVTAINISILYMYRRLFPVEEFFIRSQVVGALLVVWWLVGSVLTIVSCLPFRRFWEGPSAGGYCFDFNIYWMCMGAVEIAIDTLLLLLPVPLVLGLHLSRQQKILVLGIFALGGFVIVTGLVRVIVGYRPGSQNVAFARAELWSAVHIGTAIVCACLPTLKPLVKRASTTASTLRRKYRSSTRASMPSSATNRSTADAKPKVRPQLLSLRWVGSEAHETVLLTRGSGDLVMLPHIDVKERNVGMPSRMETAFMLEEVV